MADGLVSEAQRRRRAEGGGGAPAVRPARPSVSAACAGPAAPNDTAGEAPDARPAPGPIDRAEWVRGAVARYERPLIRYAAHLLGGDVDRARDLAQETFLRLCDQDPPAVAPHLAEWLYTVCRNLAIDARRKDRRLRRLGEGEADVRPASDPAPGAAAERADDYAATVRALGRLSQNQQEVLRLKFQHGLSYKQIAEVTRLTATNVGFLIHAGLKKLRRQMGGEEGE
jgi:RNA polymerase sigma factor (sigma-70 family)